MASSTHSHSYPHGSAGVSHGHAHHVPGHSGHGHDFAAANRAYFDENAEKLEEQHPGWREMARKQVDAMREAWPELFNKEGMTAMDFACGIGMISENLYPHVKSIVGVDISQNSVDRYNALAEKLERAPEQMRAICIELKGEPGELDGAQFDLIVCCASYHHFASIDDTTHMLAARLAPGGALLVADIKAADDDRKLFPDTHVGLVPHTHGISETRLREAFEGAGLSAFEMRDATTAPMPHWGADAAPMTWFVARGIKPAA